MRGMGADAFFALPVEKQEQAKLQQDNSSPVLQSTSVEVQSATSTPIQQPTTSEQRKQEDQDRGKRDQEGDTVVLSSTGTEVQKHSGIQVKQQGSTMPKRDTSVILDQDGEVKYIKVSYYISPDQDLKLEEIKLKRRRRGVKVDKSELIREAIDKLGED
jgi:hypothetical protein